MPVLSTNDSHDSAHEPSPYLALATHSFFRQPSPRPFSKATDTTGFTAKVAEQDFDEESIPASVNTSLREIQLRRAHTCANETTNDARPDSNSELDATISGASEPVQSFQTELGTDEDSAACSVDEQRNTTEIQSPGWDSDCMAEDEFEPDSNSEASLPQRRTYVWTVAFDDGVCLCGGAVSVRPENATHGLPTDIGDSTNSEPTNSSPTSREFRIYPRERLHLVLECQCLSVPKAKLRGPEDPVDSDSLGDDGSACQSSTRSALGSFPSRGRRAPWSKYYRPSPSSEPDSKHRQNLRKFWARFRLQSSSKGSKVAAQAHLHTVTPRSSAEAVNVLPGDLERPLLLERTLPQATSDTEE
ncbi:hypothetical protein L226DRAFT_171538 [Lentinus tigrinus ALCF2SS1-7]|uniref:Uncharacterized protein n=1 Tax=Lentinus tigrinus ALCF2SS1-6 TaxID=1328759 RepID=A0A5C2S076_9APHY|nr:hypothetical protein L227DRAFT_656037 [Lentinus tigrinus ALCF2SS1-6]RPD71606.1 hypothetical protein L226DRAFT_171538 [Lentinus tigrinus ALCF2SS1-7]